MRSMQSSAPERCRERRLKLLDPHHEIRCSRVCNLRNLGVRRQQADKLPSNGHLPHLRIRCGGCGMLSFTAALQRRYRTTPQLGRRRKRGKRLAHSYKRRDEQLQRVFRKREALGLDGVGYPLEAPACPRTDRTDEEEEQEGRTKAFRDALTRGWVCGSSSGRQGRE